MTGAQRGKEFMIADRTAVTLVSGRSGSVGARLAVAGALVLVMLAVCAASASAVIVETSPGRFLSYAPPAGASQAPPARVAPRAGSSIKPYAPASECFGENCRQSELEPLTNKGPGEVMRTSTTYFVYWDPTNAPYPYQEGYESGITTYFKGLAHDDGADQNFYSVLTQYYSGSTSANDARYETHFGKALIDRDLYPAIEPLDCQNAFSTPCVDEEAIEAELRKLVKAKKLPSEFKEPYTGGEEAHIAYFVLLPPGVVTCFGGKESTGYCSDPPTNVFCAYHSYVNPTFTEAGIVEGLEAFAVQPYTVGNKGCESGQRPNGISDGALSGGVVHEFAEMITDPFGLSWLNSNSAGEEEVADICSNGFWATGNTAFAEKMRYGTPLGTAPNGALYNQVVDGRDYYYQQEWSNETGGCQQRKPLPPAVSKIAPVTGPETGGTSVKITGLNFKAPEVTAVKFGEKAAAKFTVTSATSLTAVSPASSPGSVDITLTNAAGQSVTVSADKFTFTPPPTVSSVTPNTGPAAGGTGVTVKGLNFLAGKTATTFKFGTAKATSVSCASTTECTMLSPAHAAGSIDVIATVNKLSSPVVAGDKYTYS